jgi:uncharacterized Fe-S cluster protein YjdI
MQKKYSNGEVTIIWKPDACIHSTICWKGLRAVFNPTQRPWVKPEGADTERIIAQVKQCPSGALSYYMNSEEGRQAGINAGGVQGESGQSGQEMSAQAEQASGHEDPAAGSVDPGNARATHIELRPNGPIVVHNECMIRYADGRQEMREAKVFLCRCGASSNKPFCDGSHKKTGFEG